jgi:hypothetical protein
METADAVGAKALGSHDVSNGEEVRKRLKIRKKVRARAITCCRIEYFDALRDYAPYERQDRKARRLSLFTPYHTCNSLAHAYLINQPLTLTHLA